MRKAWFFVLLGCLTLSLPAFAESQGWLRNDTLTLTTGRITRQFLWNGGELITRRVADVQRGVTLESSSKSPDFLWVDDKSRATDAHFEINRVPDDGICAEHLEAVVEYRKGQLEVRRVYFLYNDCATMRCETFLRGALRKDASMTSAGEERGSIEDQRRLHSTVQWPSLDGLQLQGRHWQTKIVEFADITDRQNNLVRETTLIPYRRSSYQGNLLLARNNVDGTGFFFLKEAPNTTSQLHYRGVDFLAEYGTFQVTGIGVAQSDLHPTEWVRAYSCVLGLWSGDETEALWALRDYQKRLRRLLPERDEMVMMNTWGDRGQDRRINEAFCLAELERCHRLGISCFQVDDGWESGKSPNSALAKGSFKDIWQRADYWKPDTVKFPRSFHVVTERARELGIKVGLWFNPSVQHDFSDWEKDAAALIELNKLYGVEVFKIDGLEIPTRLAEENLRRLFDKVIATCGPQIVFNLDATAGQRGGYFLLNRYGNVFLENRYTDWGNYYPYQTLRNLWQLSRYVPPEKLQIEFLNPWRNKEKYPAADMFAPNNYSLDYLFALTMAGQPLAWMESGNLPETAFALNELIRKYREVQHEFHRGYILPIGEEPSGRSWTGFQSIDSCRQKGFLLVYREDNDRPSVQLKTYFTAGRRLSLQPVLGAGRRSSQRVEEDGTILLSLPQKNTFALYRYQLEK